MDVRIDGFELESFLISVSGIMILANQLDDKIQALFSEFCGFDVWRVKDVEGEVFDKKYR